VVIFIVLPPIQTAQLPIFDFRFGIFNRHSAIGNRNFPFNRGANYTKILATMQQKQKIRLSFPGVVNQKRLA